MRRAALPPPAATAVFVVLSSLALGAGDCEQDPPKEDAGTTAPEEFECELGLPGWTELDFVPLSESNEAELQVGFQGFALAPVRVRMAPDAPTEFDVVGSIEIEGEGPRSIVAPGSAIALDDGQLLTRDVLITFNNDLWTNFVGKNAHVALRIDDDAQNPRRRCIAEGDIVFVDENECIHTGDVPRCPFDCEIGVPGATATDFIPIAESNEIELGVDAQGVSYAPLRVRMSAEAPDTFDATGSVSVESIGYFAIDDDGVTTVDLGDGSRLTRDIRVPVPRDQFSNVAGQSAALGWFQILEQAERPSKFCALGREEVIEVRFVDENECVHTGDVPDCGDAGPEPVVDAGPDPEDAGPAEGDAGT